jgi:hypothetical protein
MYGPDLDWKKINAINRAKKLEEEKSENYNKAKAEGRIAAESGVTVDLKNKIRREILDEIQAGKLKEIEELEIKKACLEDSIENCGKDHTFKIEPRGEFETEMLFLTYAHHLGFYELVRNNKYPDYFAKKDGKKCTIELEYLSGFFISHNHDPAKADYIVCWRHNTDQIERLPANIIELKSALNHFYKSESLNISQP